MPEKQRLSQDDWQAVADFVVAEKERRAMAPCRKDKERIWKEIDRQIAMEPVPRETISGEETDWLPNTELPLQFNTLEVNAADARRLKFPRGSDWYQISAHLSDDYIERWNDRRESKKIIGDMPDEQGNMVPIPVKLDQETANTLVKATIDSFHRSYNFRAAIDLFDGEMIKYGTGVVRTRQVSMHSFFHDWRGTESKSALGPAVIPMSIKNVFLDDSPVAVMHEGITHAPAHIRRGKRRIDDVLNAIKKGGPERGWRQSAIRKLAAEKTEHPTDNLIEYLEIEGDLIVPRSRSSIFLPNVIVTVAQGRRVREVIRFRENDTPFNAYDVGYYMRQDVDDPYGVSPLMKGAPLQEAATLALNEMMAGAALNARPPCFYDRNDMTFTAAGGPRMHPGAMNATDSPNAAEWMDRVNLGELTNTYLGLVKQYEDLTAVNDPRRSGTVLSHTTAHAVEIEQARGLSRTDDFVQDVETGPLTSILNKEYWIIKRSLKSAVPIPVDMGGIEGWITVAGADLADDVSFMVTGSAGVLDERQKMESFVAATNIVTQMVGLAAQLGTPLDIDFAQLAEEIYRRAGINNARKFINATGAGGAAGPAQEGAALPQPPVTGVPQNDLTDLASFIRAG